MKALLNEPAQLQMLLARIAESRPRLPVEVSAGPVVGRPSPGAIAASAGLHDEAALGQFISAVLKLAGATAGAVRVRSADGGGLSLLASVGLSDEVVAAEEYVGACGVCGDAMNGDEVCVAASPRRCGRLESRGGIPSVAGGAVAVPLEHKGHPVGVFTLFFAGVNSLRPEVIHLLRPIGQLLGLTLENAKLERERSEAALGRERQAIASEIHDSIAQSLTFARMRLPLLREAIGARDDERALRYCADVGDELASANRSLRDLITTFRTGMDGEGFSAAVRGLVDAFRRRSPIELDVCPEEIAVDLPRDAQIDTFRIVQEALTNVQRHSGARRASLRFESDARGLTITIEDDGRGLADPNGSAPGDRAHYGLRIMAERARAIGADLSVGRAGADGGTLVRLFIASARADR